jgi:hypothetical protein
MKALFTYLALVTSTFASSAFAVGDELFETVLQVKAKIDSALESTCGLQGLDPYDPRLPRPQIVAHTAFANMDSRYLSGYYVREHNGFETDFIYEQPNGANVVRMTLTENGRLKFVNALGGMVARVTTVYTPYGRAYTFYCRSGYPVPREVFVQCVEERFVSFIVDSFCSW